MAIRIFQPDDIVYVIIADCGGGDDENPHRTLESALKRIEEVDGPDATGLEIWKTAFKDWEYAGEVDSDFSPGEKVWERW